MLDSPIDGQGSTAPAPFSDEQAADSFMSAMAAQGGA